MPSRGYTARVYNYYKSRMGEYVHFTDAAKDLNLTADQANAAVNRLSQNPRTGVRRMSGHNGIYGYFGAQPDADEKPAPAPVTQGKGDLLEILGQAGKFGILARDSNGQLYRVEKID